MRIKEICEKLRNEIPKHTDMFSGDIENVTWTLNNGKFKINSISNVNIGDLVSITDCVLSNDQIEDTFLNKSFYINNLPFNETIIPKFATDSGTGRVHKEVRIFNAVYEDQAREIFRGTEKPSICILDLGSSASRKNTGTDLNNLQSSSNGFNYDLVNNFEILVFLPFKDTKLIGLDVDIPRILLEYLLYSIAGDTLSSYGDRKSYGINFLSMITREATAGYLIQSYTFEVGEVISADDINTNANGLDTNNNNLSIGDVIS